MTSNSTKSCFVIATGNPGKCREFAALLADFISPHWKIFDRQNFPDPLAEVEETGSTFRENAILKAAETSRQTGCPALADDSGLDVDALGGAPGVYSARYAGEDATDDDNNHLLIERLKGVPTEERTARFVSVICLALPDHPISMEILARRDLSWDEVEASAADTPGDFTRQDDLVLLWFRGTVEGRIAEQPAGDRGFGYDPYFFVPQWGKTMAEVPLNKKNSISHRADAARQLVAFFGG